MPLLEIQCGNGHTSEVLQRRGGGNTPLLCPTCGENANRNWSAGFGFNVKETHYAAPPKDPNNKAKPEFIDRMGGGKAAKTENNLYRPAITHNTKCPKEGKWRNVAILNDLKFARRLCCEGCGYTWLYRAETAPNPLFDGTQEKYRPGKTYSRLAPAGSGYEQPKRGA